MRNDTERKSRKTHRHGTLGTTSESGIAIRQTWYAIKERVGLRL